MSQNRFYQIFMIFISLTPVISVFAPRAMTFWPLLIGIVLAPIWCVALKEKLHIPKFFWVIFISFIGISSISNTFGINTEHSFEASFKIWGLCLATAPFIGLCNSINTQKLKPYGQYLSISLILASLITACDLATNLGIYKLYHSGADRYSPSELNRGLVVLSTFYFFALIFLNNALIEKSKKIILRIAMTAILMTTALLSDSQSAPATILVGLFVYFIYPYRLKYTGYICAFLLSLGIILSPLIAMKMYAFMIESPESFTWLKAAYPYNRIEIWNFIAKESLMSPFIGHGISATRLIEFDHDMLYHRSEYVLHPHNIFLQIWIELGLLGIIPCCLFFGAILLKIRQMPSKRQKIVAASLISFLGTASISYGIWQSWWLGLEFLMIGFYFLSRIAENK